MEPVLNGVNKAILVNWRTMKFENVPFSKL